MASAFRAYNRALLTSPYLTGSASAAFLFGSGDVIAQQAIDKKGKDHDFVRTARLAAYGGIIFSPVVTRWYKMLDGLKITSKPALVAARVGLDQFVLTPVMVGVFFSSMALGEGKGVDEVQRRLENAYFPTLLKNWGLFIPVQLANFSVVPAHLRLLLVNVVSLGWNTYLSAANSATAKEDAIEAKVDTAKGLVPGTA